jgi:hypothetical protein
LSRENTHYEKVKRVKEKYEDFLMSKEGVVGCSIGYKVVRGERTRELSIVCLVKEKKPEESLSKKDLVPREIEGVPVDVVEVGEIEKL